MNVDNIDRDLFGRHVRGAMYQPVDETLDKYKKAAYDLVRAAYIENVVRAPACHAHHQRPTAGCALV